MNYISSVTENGCPDRSLVGWTVFHSRFYSQKMLYELASDTGAFLRVCDESPVVNKRGPGKRRWDQLEGNI